MLRYAVTITLSAFLLFQVQPLIARFILPWFGGTPAVWTTCMLFFQVVLLLGYAYAHFVDRWLRPRTQAIVHSSLLLMTLVTLPIIPSEFWKPTGDEWPTARILLLLAMTIGLPYGMVSTTGPLLQAWFRRTHPTRTPYRLFALSNAGSLIALLSYPFLFEPYLRLGVQAYLWSGAFAVFAVLAIYCSWRAIVDEFAPSANGASEIGSQDAANQTGSATAERKQPDAPAWNSKLMWLGLSMVPSVLLLATTSQLSQEVAVVPFLWVLPLSLYLLTFIICFDSPRWYRRPVMLPLMVIFNLLAALSLARGVHVAIWVQMIAFCGALFINCMCCHGELARDKPDPKYLTLFYLIVSIGGAMGGVFVVLIAPYLFVGYYELHVGLAAAFALTLIAYLRRPDWIVQRLPSWANTIVAGVAIGGMALLMVLIARDSTTGVLEKSRGFYGTLTISETTLSRHAEYGARRTIRNGRIKHGSQFTAPEYRLAPGSYYAKDSGIGLAIRMHPQRREDSTYDLHLGVVGLGAGALASYGEVGDRIRFYEINPEVIRVARRYFYYLNESPAEVQVVLGDARIQLEREIQRGEVQQFDVLAIDAFSSDAIPMHLLTRECLEIYLKHLKPDGILAIHISNRYLDLAPVVYHLAREQGFEKPLRIKYDPPQELDFIDDASDWVLLTRNDAFLHHPDLQPRLTEWSDGMPEVIWTDDFGSLWQVMHAFDLEEIRGLFSK